MSRYAPYPTYKDSGVEWLGVMPEHWDFRRLKFVATVQPSNVDKKSEEEEQPVFLCNYSEVYNNEFIRAGMEFMKATAKNNEIIKFSISKGDVIVTKDSESADDIAIPAYVEDDFQGVLCGYHLAHIKPISISGKYLFRLFQSRRFNAQFTVSANGVTRFGLPQDVINDAFVSIPPLPEQEAIARFLDYKTAQIDALVAKRVRLLEKLAEKRIALISQAVTKGIDANVPMKESSVDWLGIIPAHWQALRIKRFTSVKRGASPRPIDDPKYFDEEGEYAWVRIADVTASERYLEVTTQRLSELGKSLSVSLEPGDIFLSIAGSVGKPIITKIKCCIHDGFVYFPLLSANREFLYYIFSSGQPYLGLGKLGTQLNLNTDTVGSIVIGLPPAAEQESIVQYLDEQTSKLDMQRAKILQAIDKLKEYRAALITNAVTGKIDVRNVDLLDLTLEEAAHV